MNYLGHLFLAEVTDTSRLGSILGDFVKGRDFEKYTAVLNTGIVLHRQIDGFTDRHFVNTDLRHLFPKHLQRYRGICLDLFWDYCLSQSWMKYYPHSKKQFICEHYAILERELGQLEQIYINDTTDRAKSVISRMIGYDWLSSYQEIANIHLALERIGQRLRKPIALGLAAEILKNHEETIQIHFDKFFPEIIQFSKTTAEKLILT